MPVPLRPKGTGPVNGYWGDCCRLELIRAGPIWGARLEKICYEACFASGVCLLRSHYTCFRIAGCRFGRLGLGDDTAGRVARRLVAARRPIGRCRRFTRRSQNGPTPRA